MVFVFFRRLVVGGVMCWGLGWWWVVGLFVEGLGL